MGNYRSSPGLNPLGYQGVRASQPAQMIISNRTPTSHDLMGGQLGTQWLHIDEDDQDASEQFVLVSTYTNNGGTITQNSAVWVSLSSSVGILPDHSVVLGTGTAELGYVGPNATPNLPLISQGVGSDPIFDILPVAGGGTGIGTMTTYAVLCGGTTATGDVQQVSGVGTAGQVLTSNGAGALPTWQNNVDPNLPNHSVALGTGAVGLNSVGPSATIGFPLISQGAAADPIFDTLIVSGGGTGANSFTAYSVICGGVMATSTLQSVSGVGTAGQVLTSNGAGALPTWQNSPGVNCIVTSYAVAGSGTHDLNANTKMVEVFVWSGGGGGGGGRVAADGAGGGGGGGSGFTHWWSPVSFFGGGGASVSYTVGTGGAGGASATNGNDGNESNFASIYAASGKLGTSAAATGGVGGSGGGGTDNVFSPLVNNTPTYILNSGGHGVDNGGSNGTAGFIVHGTSLATGGGGGGFVSGNGLAGGDLRDARQTGATLISGGTAGAAGGAGGAGNPQIATYCSGGTGGGGGAGGGATGGAGGVGGAPGGGGGGGGGGTATGGAGGNGADGAIIVVEYL